VANEKKRSPVFGPRNTTRPDILPFAETIELPAAVDVQALRPYAHPPAPTTPLALPFWGAQGYVPSRRRTAVSRLSLLAILCLQALLSLRLHNTAFEDEALYLYVGRLETAHLLHGAALPGSYAAYFSGAPVLYPILAAALNAVGGLALARGLSLAEMLAITAMLYSCARFLFNERTALCAAALFSVATPVLFLGNFATFDATSLFLLASATTIAVRTSRCRWPLFTLAAPLAALAVTVKYAGLMFVPTIAVLPVLAGWPALRGWAGRHRAWLAAGYPVAFCAVVAGLLYGALLLGGHDYLNALSTTTTARAAGTTPALTILRESGEWGGIIAGLAAFGTVAYTRRVRTEPDELIAPAGGPLRRVVLGAVLTGTALLAPAYQLHLHTDVSLHKHVGFGLFFAAPMAGLGLARLVGDHFRKPQIGITVWSAALAIGMMQSAHLYHGWPSSGPLVRALSAYLQPGARYLVEVPEVPVYYLEGRADARASQFYSTFVITYPTGHGRVLTGAEGFTAAIRAGYFHVVAYSGDVTPATDSAIAKTLARSRAYRRAAVVHLSDADGPVTYDIWLKHATVPPRRIALRPRG
jgi:Dolichyl-phosphate-mannose-protein mannosyltransferase